MNPGFDPITPRSLEQAANEVRDEYLRNAEIVKALQQPELREQFAKLGMEPVGGPPQALAERMKKDLPITAELVRKSGASAD